MTVVSKARIYLDYNATAPIRAVARERLLERVNNYGNESSVHAEGRAARAAIESARAEVAALTGAQPETVIFNSGATEGNNTVLAAFAGREGGILASAIEHLSVLEAVAPDAVTRIPVTPQGVVDLAALEDLCARQPRPALISVMLANNETGAIQPLADIVAIAGRKNIPVHCDAVQAAGRIPVDIGALGVDFLTLSGHKIGGGPGAGALIPGGCGAPPVLLRGGGQERGARAGTANVPAIAAFGAAARAAREGLAAYAAQVGTLRDALERGIENSVPETVFFARQVLRVANTSLFALPGLSSRTALIHFDLEGIAISNGSACSSGVVKTSHVLRAMGVAEDVAECALRVSLGWDSTEDHVFRFLESWEKLVKRVKKSV